MTRLTTNWHAASRRAVTIAALAALASCAGIPTESAQDAPAPARPNDLHVNLLQNMERLNLQATHILPLHGRMVPVSELLTAVGRKS